MRPRLVALLLLLCPSVHAQDPIPGRTRIPEDAKLLLVWTVEMDGTDELHIRGRKATVVHRKGKEPRKTQVEFSQALPRNELGVFARFRRGRGEVAVLQDPGGKNGHQAIVQVKDDKRGWAKQQVEVYFGARPPPPPPFPVTVPAAVESSRHRPLQMGGIWRMERSTTPLFRWKGKVDGYAVLLVTAEGLTEHGDARKLESSWHTAPLEGRYVVLSRCKGPGRVRVIQRMNVKGAQPMIEIDDRAVDGPSTYSLVGHAVQTAELDQRYDAPKDPNNAQQWIDMAVRTRSRRQRLWAIEKFCQLQPYPGPAPHLIEKMTLAGLSKQEKVDALPGKNAILAWPPAYLAELPTKWRFLAELDAAMEWLKYWTGKDQVAGRRKRLISRFRVDKGGVAIYVDFRLHIPRKEMRAVPDHGPYSHEASHGFIGLGAICPTGRYNEGLTEVSRTAYWWFLGIDHAWRPFQRSCLDTLKRHYEKGGDLSKVPGYGGAAGVYLALLHRFCLAEDGEPDWMRFARLFKAARALKVEGKRFELMTRAAEQAFGPEARTVLQNLRLPE